MRPEERQKRIQQVSQGLDRVQEGLAGIAERRAAATSEEARSETRSIRDEIDDAVSRDQNRLQEIAQKEVNLIEEQQSRLRQRAEEEQQRIQERFGREKQQLEQEQEGEFASRNVGLVTQFGGYLGLSQSHSGVLQSLRETHRQELGSLRAQRESALREAERAFQNRNFELARERLQIARQAENQEFTREQQLIEREISLSREQRQREQSALDQTDQVVNNIAPAIAEEVRGTENSEERDRIIAEAAEKNGVGIQNLTSAVSQSLRDIKLSELGIQEAELGLQESRLNIRQARQDSVGGGGVSGTNIQNLTTTAEQIPTFEEFVSDFADTSEGQRIAQSMREPTGGGLSTLSDEELLKASPVARQRYDSTKQLFEQTINQQFEALSIEDISEQVGLTETQVNKALSHVTKSEFLNADSVNQRRLAVGTEEQRRQAAKEIRGEEAPSARDRLGQSLRELALAAEQTKELGFDREQNRLRVLRAAFRTFNGDATPPDTMEELEASVPPQIVTELDGVLDQLY